MALGDYARRRVELGHSDIGCVPHAAARSRAGGTLSNEALCHPRQNKLLAALPGTDFERLRSSLEFVVLPSGHVLRESGCRASHAYFPVTGVLSLTQELASGAAAEVAVAGNEGMSGVTVFMGGGGTTGREFVRAKSIGYRMRAEVLQCEFARCKPLRDILLRYAQLLMTQAVQTAVCRGHHSILEQVCRFLLATLDRSSSNELALTHEFVAELLGVRRESVTVAAGALQAAGAIRCIRSRITVLDRDAVEDRVCECYATVRDEVSRLTGPEGARPSVRTFNARDARPGAARAGQLSASI